MGREIFTKNLAFGLHGVLALSPLHVLSGPALIPCCNFFAIGSALNFETMNRAVDKI